MLDLSLRNRLLNISEKRRPQDGRINFRIQGSELDIRISTMPTMYGESVSLRLLNQKSKPLSMRELGLAPSGGGRDRPAPLWRQLVGVVPRGRLAWAKTSSIASGRVSIQTCHS